MSCKKAKPVKYDNELTGMAKLKMSLVELSFLELDKSNGFLEPVELYGTGIYTEARTRDKRPGRPNF